MAILPILLYPDPRLKQVSHPVDLHDPDLGQWIQDLLETMRASPGCTGIAASQAGIPKRLMVIDASRNSKCEKHHGELVLINPEIEWQTGEVLGREGCLSIPHLTANVVRAKDIGLKALAPDGSEVAFATGDFEARLILHEMDHLDGILFLDRVSSLKTDVFRRKNYAPPTPRHPAAEINPAVSGESN